ncbi:hypothetical protein AC070_06265, partial [Fannyhessea vaginae]
RNTAFTDRLCGLGSDVEAESRCLQEKEDLCGRALGRAREEYGLSEELKECPGDWGRVGSVGWGKQNFSIKAGAFYRSLETKRGDSERGLWSQTLSNGS